jgi:hypothetical protein
MLKLLRVCGLLGFCNLLTAESFALSGEDLLLSNVKAVRVDVQNSVRDDCLQNSKSITNKAELGFIRNGIKVTNNIAEADTVLWINVLGGRPYKASNLLVCIGTIIIQVFSYGTFQRPGVSTMENTGKYNGKHWKIGLL